MHRPSSLSQSEKKPGVLEHLSEGMSLLLAAPRLMLIPVLLDLYLLLGPRISTGALTDRVASWSRRQEGDSALEVADWFGSVGDWDVSRLMALLVPSVVDGLPGASMFEPYGRGYHSPSIAVLVLAGIGFALLGTALFVGYLVALARYGDLIRANNQGVARLLLDRWIKFLGFGAVMVAIAVIGMVAVLIPAVVLTAGGISGGVLVGFLSLAMLSLLLLTMFVPEAIVVDGAGPFRAIRSSATVVVTSFWPAIGLFVVSLMFSPGLLSIWEEIASDPVGLGIAIVANAALITSLALASLSFYRSRSQELAPDIRAA